MTLTISTTLWTAADVALADSRPLPAAPVIAADDAQPFLPGIDIWDMWPVQDANGRNSIVCGGTLWMALSAPVMGDPVLRHFHARVRLLHQVGNRWHDGGHLFPDGHNPGNREWSGSAVLRDDGEVTVYFTAAGSRGEQGGYRQRLFATSAKLDKTGGVPVFGLWSSPHELFAADGEHYRIVDQRDGEIGKIKAFRDPGFFRDPADGSDYIVFTGSLARSRHSHDGCIGIARSDAPDGTHWSLLPPLISADALNNELERPHIRVHNGLYYLFWSTQRSVFASLGTSGPTGLYGMVASSLFGPYQPLNGSGLVIANPEQEPAQAFSWLVMEDLRVTSFVDAWGLRGRAVTTAAEARAHFGGRPAPMLMIGLDENRSTVSGTSA